MSEQAPHHLSHALQRDLSERCYGWLESLAEGCVVLDPTLLVRYCNPAFAAVWGRSVAELLGATLTNVLPAFATSACLRLCEQTLRHARLQEGDARLGAHCFRVRVHPLADGVLVLMADVTARRQVEDDLANTALQLRLLLDQVSAVNWTVDRDLHFLRFAGAGLSHLGLAENEVVGQTLFEFFRTSDPEHLAIRMHRRALEGEEVRYAQDLAGRHYDVGLRPTRDGKGRVVGVTGLAGDVTEQRRTEVEHVRLRDQLYQVQKLESLGVLVGGVAHDFNNLLVGMLNGAELLLRDLPADSALRETAVMICNAGRRARDVARQMLVLVGKGKSARRPLDVNLLLRENLFLLQSAFADRVRVQAELEEGLPFVEADSGQMQQVVMNLLVNAAEALPAKGGTVRVATGWAASADGGGMLSRPLTDRGDTSRLGRGRESKAHGGESPPHPFVFIEVADDGHGMEPEVQARIFEAFFTTKPSGHGLGLAAVRDILHAHNGVIRLNSTPGKGTTFRVYLPGVLHAAGPVPGPRPADPSAPSDEVLIIDDESFVRDVIARMLHHAGYATRTAANGPDALAQVRDHPTIGLVVLDLKMPVMGGWETLRRLGEIRPHLKAILTSGCSDEELPRPGDPRLVGFLSKPYVFANLLQLVRQGFGHHRPS